MHLGGDLGPDVVPQRAPAGRGERLDLHFALPVLDCHPGAVLLGHDELDLVLGPDRHLQAAQIHPLLRGESLPRVPRAALRTRGARRLRVLSQLIVGRPAVIELVAGQLLITVPGPIPARVC